MRVLALDTASPAPALALLLEAGRMESEALDSAAAESLPARLEALLSRGGVSLSSLAKIAVLSGPGSFTGLRAGTAFARGLARALEVPLVALSTFRVAADALPHGDADLLLDAGRGEVHRARRRGAVLEENGRPLPLAEAQADAARDGVPLRRLEDERPRLAEALARAADADSSTRDLVLLYGRPSAAEERWGGGG